MQQILNEITFWGHGAAAAVFIGLAIWYAQRTKELGSVHITLLFALGMTGFWGLTIAVEGPFSAISNFGEQLRNFGWLAFMYALLRSGSNNQTPNAIKIIYILLAGVLAAQSIIDSLVPLFDGSPRLVGMSIYTSLLMRVIFSVGGLVLVHNLYSVSSPEARWGIRLPMAAVAAMWTYDLNLFTIAYLTQEYPPELTAMRGAAQTLLAPIIGLGLVRNKNWKLRLSRTIAFRSLSLVAIGGYITLMIVVVTLLQIIGGEYASLAQVTFLFVTSIAAILLLPSGRFQAWFKVKLAKNFFQHRYDYRSEWIRFTNTIGRPGPESAPFHERVIKAVADITDSPAGILLMPDETGMMSLQSRWNWKTLSAPNAVFPAKTIRFFETSDHIVEFDSVRGGTDEHIKKQDLPVWMLHQPQTWAAVPLVHFGKLIGLLILAQPRVKRMLDWEDLDMLRVVGRQVASYLAEANNQEALSESRQFDEFNRRMAFILHDIKNLVSQLSLLARNAERHADNPEFRKDMVATLQESVEKMNGLLARLSQHNRAKTTDPKSVEIVPLVKEFVQSKKLLHPVELNETELLTVVADPARVEQILGHLVQNAIDASEDSTPVEISVKRRELSAVIEVHDRGMGMDSEFIRSQLFKPFTSSKEGGFGIGAFESRALAASMNGRLEVQSEEGIGSTFTLVLPLAPLLSDETAEDERAA